MQSVTWRNAVSQLTVIDLATWRTTLPD